MNDNRNLRSVRWYVVDEFLQLRVCKIASKIMSNQIGVLKKTDHFLY